MATRGTIHANEHVLIHKALLNEFPVIESKKVYGEVAINQDNYVCKGLSFINCEFDDTLRFNNVDLRLGVRFVDCIFNSGLFFDQVSATGIDDLFNSDNVGIYFKNCSHHKQLSITNSKLERALRLYKQQELSSLKLLKLACHAVDINECKIDGIDIDRVNTTIGFRIEKSEINGQGRYFGCKGDGFAFLQTNFVRDQQLWANRVRSITTNNGKFEEELKIKACQAETFTFYGTEFKKAVSVPVFDDANKINAVVDACYIQNCDFAGGIIFTGHKQEFNGLINIGKLVIKCSNLLQGNLVFEKTDIKELEISGTNVDASISFSNCGLKTVHIDNFINQGKLYFADVEAYDRKGSLFSIAKTSLGVTILLNVNFQGFEKMIIMHSNLTDILFTDVVWFSANQLNPILVIKNTKEYDKQGRIKKRMPDKRLYDVSLINREVYRQLKYTSAKIGNNVRALNFQSEEMKFYKKELDFYRWNKQFSGNKAMMWINQSNNYGNDWLKPIWILLLLNLGFFLIITILQSGDYYLWPSFTKANTAGTWSLICSHFDAFWSLLNPVRRLVDVYPDQKRFNAWTVFWDYLDRLTVSYFIFQIVSAFRKYSK